MKALLKTTLITYIAMFGVVSTAVTFANETPTSTSSTQEAAKPNPIIPEAYILYSLALRDGKAAPATDATMKVVKTKDKTTYTFKEHVLKECGSHLNGTIEVAESGSKNLVTANFPTVVNSMGITHFKFQMTEDKTNKSNSTGSGQVNDLQFAVADIVALPGFTDAIAKMQ